MRLLTTDHGSPVSPELCTVTTWQQGVSPSSVVVTSSVVTSSVVTSHSRGPETQAGQGWGVPGEDLSQQVFLYLVLLDSIIVLY